MLPPPLPMRPERVPICLAFMAPWCEPRRGKRDPHYDRFSKESLEDWHRRHGLYGGGS